MREGIEVAPRLRRQPSHRRLCLGSGCNVVNIRKRDDAVLSHTNLL
jgi:hypothetical protein